MSNHSRLNHECCSRLCSGAQFPGEHNPAPSANGLYLPPMCTDKGTPTPRTPWPAGTRSSPHSSSSEVSCSLVRVHAANSARDNGERLRFTPCGTHDFRCNLGREHTDNSAITVTSCSEEEISLLMAFEWHTCNASFSLMARVAAEATRLSLLSPVISSA